MISKLRSHLYSIYIAFTRYKSGFSYIWLRYFIAPQILKIQKVLEKPISDPDLSIHILFGHRDVCIAFWALASFYSISEHIGKLTLHDDGSLTSRDKELLQKSFPHARIVSKADLEETARQVLMKYPEVLNFFRTPFWQARKLLDTYLSVQGSHALIIDSDTLWFRNPSILMNAFVRKEQAAFMMSNAGTLCKMPFKDGSMLEDSRALLNSGIVFYDIASFSLERLEEYLSKIDIEKPHHFMEQAGFAYALSNPKELSPADYPIKGVLEKDAVMRHYTGPSRGKLFIRGIPFLLKHSLSHVFD